MATDSLPRTSTLSPSNPMSSSNLALLLNIRLLSISSCNTCLGNRAIHQYSNSTTSRQTTSHSSYGQASSHPPSIKKSMANPPILQSLQRTAMALSITLIHRCSNISHHLTRLPFPLPTLIITNHTSLRRPLLIPHSRKPFHQQRSPTASQTRCEAQRRTQQRAWSPSLVPR